MSERIATAPHATTTVDGHTPPAPARCLASTARPPAAAVSDAWRSTRHSGPQFDFGVLAIMPPLPRGRAIEWSGDGSAREVDEELTEASRQRARSIDPLAGAAYLQRKCAKCEEEDEEEEDDDEESASRMQRAADGHGLTVGPTDDAYEREADQVASAVVTGANVRVQGRVAGCGAQRAARGVPGGFASSIVGDALASEGSPLDASTRAFMEPRFGHDFSSVRIHSDARADASARAVNALAYTVGRDIVFRSGEYDPPSPRGRRLLAHELTHVCQQEGSGAGALADTHTNDRASSRLMQRQVSAPPRITGVRISCEERRIVFDTGERSYAYRLNLCRLPLGDYTVGVTISGNHVHFDFAQAIPPGEAFEFGFDIEPGQVNPVTMFQGQSQVAISVVEHVPATADVTAAPEPAPLATRLAAFQQLVKNAGKFRLAENGRALEQWRGFLQQQLTPQQVQAQVHTEEARAIIEAASQRGAAEMALAEQWLQTPGANRRWVLDEQIQGRLRACGGCHAALRADELDRARAERGVQGRTPLEQLPAGGDLGPRPEFAGGEQLPGPAHPGMFPAVTQAQQRINAVQPYLRRLGPEGYRVLPSETLGSTAPAAELVADISRRITRRQQDYREFSARIDDPGFDYLQLRPIVRDLLPLADADVRQAVEDAINAAQTWETIESIVVGAATIGLLLLAIFPPTSAIGIGGALALGTALGAHQAYRGYQSFEQGRLYSLGRGAHDVLDPEQQQAADALMAMGALNMVLGSVGVASGLLGGVRLIRSAPPGGAGVGALEAVEGTAGGNLYRVTGWRTPNPSVVITGPNGQIIREGTLSSFRSVPSAASRATRTTGGAPGEFIYGAEGGAARVAQPVPVAEPAVVPVVEPAPVVAPSAPPVWVPPDVSGNLATMGATSGVGAAADFEARRRGGAQPAPTTTTDPTPAAATQPAGQQAEEPREEEICPRGTVEIMWPPAVWRASGRQDTGAINGVFDRPPTRIVTKIPSPARNRTIIGQYVGNNWAALQAYYPRTGALGAIHHKWPLYLGGPDAISNLVFLTFAEHTVWHSALTTQTTGPVGTRYCIVN